MKTFFPHAALTVCVASLCAGCASNNSEEATSAAPQTGASTSAANSMASNAGSSPVENQPAEKQLKVGDVAPAFELRDQNNKPHKLSEYKGQAVVLAFYPADMTAGCTLEAHKLSTLWPELKAKKVQMFGISVQDVNSKKQFCDKEKITYTLLADAEKTASRDYGILQGKGVARRVTFVVAPNGKIGAIQNDVQPANADVDVRKMVDEVLKKSAA